MHQLLPGSRSNFITQNMIISKEENKDDSTLHNEQVFGLQMIMKKGFC